MFSGISGAIESKAPVSLLQGLQTIRTPVTDLVKEHLGQTVISVEIVSSRELKSSASIGGREDQRAAAYVQTQARGGRQPDDLTGIHVSRCNGPLIVFVVLVAGLDAHRDSITR